MNHPPTGLDGQFRANMAALLPRLVDALNDGLAEHAEQLANELTIQLTSRERIEHAAWILVQLVRATMAAHHPGGEVAVAGIVRQDGPSARMVDVTEAPPFVQTFSWYSGAAIRGDRDMALDVFATIADDDLTNFIRGSVSLAVETIGIIRSGDL